MTQKPTTPYSFPTSAMKRPAGVMSPREKECIILHVKLKKEKINSSHLLPPSGDNNLQHQ